MDTSHPRNKELILLQIVYLYIVPVLLLYFGVIPPEFRIVMLAGIALLLYGITRRARWTYEDLGIRRDLLKDIIPYALFTAGGIAFSVWLAHIVPHEPFLEWWENKRFLLLFIPVSVLQEIVFRGILMRLLGMAFANPYAIIILNAILFALIHVIYSHSLFVLPFTFIGGIGFAWMYYRYPNLILISASHTILNFTAMILGFFVLR
ncbi:MAG: type II CAAX endopeptidase family protein [Patescibacteria group bacterium]